MQMPQIKKLITFGFSIGFVFSALAWCVESTAIADTQTPVAQPSAAPSPAPTLAPFTAPTLLPAPLPTLAPSSSSNSGSNSGSNSSPTDETLFITQFQLTTGIPISAANATADGIDIFLNSGGALTNGKNRSPRILSQMELDRDGNIYFKTANGPAPFGKLSEASLDGSGALVLTGVSMTLKSGLVAKFSLSSSGAPEEDSSAVSLSCQTSDGKPGHQDQMTFVTSHEDVYELAFTNGQGSISLAREVKVKPLIKLLPCVAQ